MELSASRKMLPPGLMNSLIVHLRLEYQGIDGGRRGRSGSKISADIYLSVPTISERKNNIYLADSCDSLEYRR